MQTPGRDQSFISPIGYSNSSCGYCKNKSGTFYQSLLNRGWRRSGTTLYKPDLLGSCCPQYTIRLDSHGFRASKDQRQVLNRFNRFVLGNEYAKEASRLYPKSREQAKKRDTDFDLVERTHEIEKPRVKTPPEPSHAFEVTIESNSFTDEKYALFENYQRIVHKEPPHRISKAGFKNFLCTSPLPSVENPSGQEKHQGSFHQCYRLDGVLVAVGVLDLLPQCVSAVYFMYHESVHQHNFGKIGALKEIAFAKEMGYQWWYAGFYIHSCIKMRYKGDYSPSYILDPESYGWDPLDNALKKKLDQQKYVSLSRETKLSQESCKEEKPHAVMSLEEPSKESSSHGSSDSASDSSTASLPVFARSIPGILSKEQLETEIDLDHIKLRLRDYLGEMNDLVSWDTGSVEDSRSLKGAVAGLVSAVGIDLAEEMIVSFG